jgi:hypothetical protein
MPKDPFETKKFDFHEAAVDTTEVIAGAGFIGTIVVGAVAAMGEVVDQIMANGESFPGGTLGKIAGGLAITGVAFLGIHEYLDR